MKRSTIPPTKLNGPSFRSNAVRLVIAASVLHLVVTTVVFTLGHYALLPGTFDSNGIAIAVANDGVGHREDAETLGEMLLTGKFHTWFSGAYPFHVKLYSISFALFGTLLG